MLDDESGLVGYYSLKIKKEQILDKSSRWFVFFMAEPMIESESAIGTPSKILLQVVSKTGKIRDVK